MRREVQVYVEGQRLELFDNEKIIVNSSIQNVNDLAKVFTDFSQSFRVPASPHNNAIFEHFYQSDVDGQIDYQIRRLASIEVDLTPFRTGKLALEKAVLKNGRPEAYMVTFYGDIRTLQDIIGEAKLSDLDFSPYAHSYTGTQVYNRVISDSYDVTYPLISSNRIWQYNGATPSQNIDTTGGAISYTELFPAIRNSSIFDVIATQYGLTFTGNFLTDDRFTKSFLYCKNANTFLYTTPASPLNITTTSGALASSFSTTADSLTLSYIQTINGYLLQSGQHSVQIGITGVSNTSIIYYIDVYLNGTLSQTLSGSGNSSYVVAAIPNSTSLNNVYTFKIRANNAFSCGAFISYVFSGNPVTIGVPTQSANGLGFCASLSLSGNININQYIPDMRVTDYIAGIIKKFNLTIEPITQTEFKFTPLENWYQAGQIHDITKHTDIDSIDIERIKLYKKIDFLHEESKSFMNQEYKELFGLNYGDLSYQYPYDGNEYQIKVPFENILFNQFTGTNVQVAYALDENFAPYVPKPIILYQYDQVTCSQFYFNDGSTNNAVTSYYPLGQDLFYNNLNYSLNFGNDISSLLLFPVTQGTFNTYYFDYIANLYDRKNRLTYVKTILPISILTTLKLNDRLIIRDKRYVINEMTSDLTTGEVNFVLLNDLRDTCGNLYYTVPQSGGTISVNIQIPNGGIQAIVDDTGTGCTATPDTFTSDGTTVITVPANPNILYLRNDEDDTTDRVFEDGIRHRNEEGEELTYLIPVTYTYTNGTTQTCLIVISQYD